MDVPDVSANYIAEYIKRNVSDVECCEVYIYDYWNPALKQFDSSKRRVVSRIKFYGDSRYQPRKKLVVDSMDLLLRSKWERVAEIIIDRILERKRANASLKRKKQKITKVIFNGPATIVFFEDGSKAVVKCMEGDTFDPEKGLAMAIAKKFLGNKYKETFKRYLKGE